MARRSALATRVGAAALAACALAPPPAAARELWRDGERDVTLRTTLKSTLLVTRERTGGATGGESLWRLRVEPEWRASAATRVALAYEQRMRLAPADSGVAPASGVIPAEAPAPYRLRPLDRAIATRPGFDWRHELDRAFAAFTAPRAEVTLGRQAVGWGRGVLFGAVDLFAPFSPLEVDREWRRGVDAARAEVKLGPRASAEAVGAFGESLDRSAIAARLRGYRGDVDGALLFGRRARDGWIGATSSAAVGQAEVHGELAWFRCPERLPVGGRDAVKAVVGGSYRVPVWVGVPVFVEYHYSGFGVSHAADLPRALADLAWAERVIRGDTQIAGRHAFGALANADVSPELTLEALALVSPTDGSGAVAPGATLHFGDRVLLVARATLPFGARAKGRVPRSFYGDEPVSVFAQISVVD